jgi:hypothetical protein
MPSPFSLSLSPSLCIIASIQLPTGAPPLPVVLFANKCDLLLTGAAACEAGAKMEALCRELDIAQWYGTRTGVRVRGTKRNVKSECVHCTENGEREMEREDCRYCSRQHISLVDLIES